MRKRAAESERQFRKAPKSLYGMLRGVQISEDEIDAVTRAIFGAAYDESI